MFIFMGIMLDKSGVAERLMKSMQELFGRVHGGLAITVTAIGIILAASTGIIGASVVLLAVMSLPAMTKQGYNMPLALGTIASAGTLGILIPPSIMLVIMADQLGLSVGDLFMGAVFPGLMLGAFYIIYIIVRGKLNPAHLPVPDDAKPVDFGIFLNVFKRCTADITADLCGTGFYLCRYRNTNRSRRCRRIWRYPAGDVQQASLASKYCMKWLAVR